MKNLNVTKCQCGKTKDPDGNCDGSHSNKNRALRKVLTFAFVLLGALHLQSFAPIQTKTVDVNNSNLVWTGYKVTGSHAGLISIQSGNLSFDKEELTGGEFVIDMSSLSCTDLTGEYKGKLEGHLKSEDFFGVSNFPTSSIVFTDVVKASGNDFDVKADITIKGITKAIAFTVTIDGNTATSNIKIDRTEFNIRYGSGSFFDGLGDNMIYDEFNLIVNLNFK